jgi:hypothetical protein
MTSKRYLVKQCALWTFMKVRNTCNVAYSRSKPTWGIVSLCQTIDFTPGYIAERACPIQAYLGCCVTLSNYRLYPRIHHWESVSDTGLPGVLCHSLKLLTLHCWENVSRRAVGPRWHDDVTYTIVQIWQCVIFRYFCMSAKGVPRSAIGGGNILYLSAMGGGIQYMQSAVGGLLFLMRTHMVYSCNRERPPGAVVRIDWFGGNVFHSIGRKLAAGRNRWVFGMHLAEDGRQW